MMEKVGGHHVVQGSTFKAKKFNPILGYWAAARGF